MSIIKSISVGDGDTFYIKHNCDSFTIIDCYLDDSNKEKVVKELRRESQGKGIVRFISTHPDEDHIRGLDYLDGEMGIANFYCVQNQATKKDESVDFKKYCELRDSSKAFFLTKNCSRKWLNEQDDQRGSAGINILWPDTTNEHYKEALEKASKGESPNNISAIVKYSVQEGAKILWMGDLETEFMKDISDHVNLSEIDILFAPHHGRNSGRVPSKWLEELNPKIIIVGEAPSEYLNYYAGYNTITQNSSGDITLECNGSKIHIYVSNKDYSVDYLDNENMNSFNYYIGTLNL
jgi:beta-lactamase superfamily II metal-dependent hydrolase